MTFTDVLFATVVSITDGDTITVNINNCAIDVLCKHVPVRLAGYDAPELHGKCQREIDLAKLARDMVRATYPVGSTIVLSDNGRDKYFRLDSRQGVVEKKLLDAGLAVPYGGGKKTKDWCK